MPYGNEFATYQYISDTLSEVVTVAKPNEFPSKDDAIALFALLDIRPLVSYASDEFIQVQHIAKVKPFYNVTIEDVIGDGSPYITFEYESVIYDTTTPASVEEGTVLNIEVNANLADIIDETSSVLYATIIGSLTPLTVVPEVGLVEWGNGNQSNSTQGYETSYEIMADTHINFDIFNNFIGNYGEVMQTGVLSLGYVTNNYTVNVTDRKSVV